MAQYDLNLRDYWRILKKRKGIVFAVTVLFGFTAFVVAEFRKPDPIYQTTAVVKFERMTTLVGLLVENISLSSGDNLSTQSAVVRSFPVLERAAKALRLIPPDLDSDAIKRNPEYVQRVSDLRARVTATPEENTTLINITVTAPDAAQSARMANAVAEAYREENVATRNRQIREARRFIEEQLGDVGERLKEAEDGIRGLKERRGFVSLTEETTASLARLTALETEYEKVRQVQRETTNQIQILQEPQVVTGLVAPRIFTDAGDPTIAKLSASLLDLGVERENLLITLTPAHPQIIDLNARIATARENLLRELRLKIQTFQGRGAELQRQIQQIRQDLRTLPEVARQYAQLQRDMTINETLFSQLRSKLQEVQIKEKEQVEEVTLVRPATEPSSSTNPPGTFGKGLVGALIGLTIGLVLAFVLESMDTSIGTIQDVETYLEVPVLGLIPNIDAVKDPSLAPLEGEEGDETLGKMRPFLVSLLSAKSTIAEAYRSLRTNVEFLSLEKHIKTLLMTSASLMEGKTTTAINLAITAAQMGKKVLLVEADLRRPFVHHAFGLPRDPGLAEIIVGNKDWRECLRTVTDLMLGPLGLEKVMGAPNIDKLFILPSGTPPPNPAEFLNSQRMTDLIAVLRQEFDLVIFDCSPILPVTDAAILAAKVDGTLIVYRVGRTARNALKRAKTLLENVRGRVLGIILTGVRSEVSADYEELEYYRYAYGQEPTQRTPGHMVRQAGESFLRRAAGLLAGVSVPALLIRLVFVGLLVLGVLAWWFGIWPTDWLNGQPPEPRKASTVLQPPVEEKRAAPSPEPAQASGGEAAPAVAPVIPASPPEQPKASPASIAGPTAALPGSKPRRGTPRGPGAERRFSLQVASRNDPAVSFAYADSLRGKGLEAFTTPAEIPGRGVWYRVFVGGFGSSSQAARTAEDLQTKGVIEAALVVSLPYAVEAGMATAEQASETEALVRRSGYLPTLRPNGGGDSSAGSTRLLRVDAFRTSGEAERLADLLRAGGLSPRVIRR
jgi:capsular exopolysaccharide synthesis family protein